MDAAQLITESVLNDGGLCAIVDEVNSDEAFYAVNEQGGSAAAARVGNRLVVANGNRLDVANYPDEHKAMVTFACIYATALNVADSRVYVTSGEEHALNVRALSAKDDIAAIVAEMGPSERAERVIRALFGQL